MPPRIPTQADFAPLSSTLPISLHFPSPPESTTAFLILFHGLGDHELPFATFARNLSLPGVLAISVRGTSPLLPSLLSDEADNENRPHFHWGDDISLDQRTGELDADPGFEKAARAVMDNLVKGILIGKCGWEMNDVIFFGFGQGGSLALGLAAQLAAGELVEDVSDGEKRSAAGSKERTFKGVVSIGGTLPRSMVPTRSARPKCETHVLVCQLDKEEASVVQREFRDVQVIRWDKKEVAMPRSREEVFPIMKFFADRLKGGW